MKQSQATNELLQQSREAMRRLQAELETERERRSKVAAELQEAKRALSAERMNAAGSQVDANEKQEREARLLQELTMYKTNEAALQQQVEAAEKRAEGLGGQLVAVKKRYDKLQQLARRQHEELERLREDTRQIEQVRESNVALRSAKAVLKEKVRDQDELIDTLRAQLEDMKREREQASGSANDKDTQLQQASELLGRVKALEAENRRLATVATTSASSLVEKWNELQEEWRERVEQRTHELDERLRNVHRQERRLAEAIHGSAAQLEQARAHEGEQLAQLETVVRERDRLAARIEEVRAKEHATGLRNAALEEQLASLRREMDRLRDKPQQIVLDHSLLQHSYMGHGGAPGTPGLGHSAHAAAAPPSPMVPLSPRPRPAPVQTTAPEPSHTSTSAAAKALMARQSHKSKVRSKALALAADKLRRDMKKERRTVAQMERDFHHQLQVLEEAHRVTQAELREGLRDERRKRRAAQATASEAIELSHKLKARVDELRARLHEAERERTTLVEHLHTLRSEERRETEHLGDVHEQLLGRIHKMVKSTEQTIVSS